MAPTAITVDAGEARPGEAPSPMTEGSQPRWKYLAHGSRPRGRERWRFDLGGRDASGEPATDGTLVYVAAVAVGDNGLSDGEVYAFDLADGGIHWHVPMGGIHGEPLEYDNERVLIDTLPHGGLNADAGQGTAHLAGGLIGLDSATGNQLFRTGFGSEALSARWSAAVVSGQAWSHDGATAIRAVTLSSGAPGTRWDTHGMVTSLLGIEDSLVGTTRTARGTRFFRHGIPTGRDLWSKTLPYVSSCPPVRVGPVLVLPSFSSETVAGGARGVGWDRGDDLWSSGVAPHTVGGCAVAEGAVLYQVEDGAVTGTSVADGRRRSAWPLPGAPTGDLALVLDGVFYVSLRARLVGIDLSDGHTAVDLPTGASRVTGMILWNGKGVIVTENPGTVIGFD